MGKCEADAFLVSHLAKQQQPFFGIPQSIEPMGDASWISNLAKQDQRLFMQCLCRCRFAVQIRRRTEAAERFGAALPVA